jgi:hypothetical protein|tara:strand:- start:398 stop:601 length:204 start_codon:yes stop_codon:yes gene_type:complete
MSKRRHQQEAINKYDIRDIRDSFEKELLLLKEKLTLGQIITMYSILREELSVLEYDFTIGSLREDDA